jgi:hypothetical protein
MGHRRTRGARRRSPLIAHAAMTRFIDITDAKLKIPVNAAVMDYIGRANPFAHSDLGAKLVELGQGIAGAHVYCPDAEAFAYVVLHDDANVVFAAAWGMSKIALRLPKSAEALADGGGRSEIGDDWLAFAAFPEDRARALATWCAAAYAHAQTLR